ncbi:extracellular solute-binding protein [Cohnella herbarum]|uniref:Extracellular solute-binding protein n=1 Tax=Cohnella herbarum TaxID=2728023 RepID=A0A7Z2ZJH5_9BACL|nr:extracellular solute-binding protein [Cohnella herbarum]QJD81908.1 extracellular solute-binding protein [Cohnella herbarum]
MKGKWYKAPALLAVALTLTLSAACTENGGNNAGESPKASPPTSASPAASPSASAPAEEDGPFGKYDPPIEVTTVRAINAGVKFREGDSYDDNVWYRNYATDLGIKVTNKWKVSDQQYKNKVLVSMVGGELPDFLVVDDQQFQTLAQAGQLADLTDLYDKYTSPLTKKSLEEAGGIKLDASRYNGRLVGIPVGGGGRDDGNMLWIRKDWLDKLGLKPPKTMDDVMKIAIAFANNDPDGNGKKDTWGLSLDYNLFGGWSALDGFFNGYHAYPFNPARGSGVNLVFLKDANGKPVFADTKPEVKTALGKLQELYKAGAINPEFTVIDGVKSGDLATQGKVGMSFGAWWIATWPVNNMKNDDPKVDWQAYPLVSADDKPAKALTTGALPRQFYVVKKEAKHPEAVFKLLNYYNDKMYGYLERGGEVEKQYTTVTENDVTYGPWAYAAIGGSFADLNQDDYRALNEAIASGDTSKLSTGMKNAYADIEKYKAGDNTLWAAEAVRQAFAILGDYKKNDLYVMSSYFGPPTETMKTKGPTLRDNEIRAFEDIITGDKPIEYFDEWVKGWHEQGGDQILQEVADGGALK